MPPFAATFRLPGPWRTQQLPAAELRSYSRIACAVLAGLTCLCTPTGADAPALSRREVPAVRISSPPKIDGDPGDAVWQSVPVCDGFSDGYDLGAAPEATRVRIAYDNSQIYVFFECDSADPASIVAQQTRKEGSLQQDDHVSVLLNPFGTQRFDDESEFSVNPIGTVATDIAGGRAGKEEWLGNWSAAAQRTDKGWRVELSIPWDVLTRPSGTGPREMNVNFVRYHAASRRTSFWSNLGPNRRTENTGRWTGVQLPPPIRTNPLSILLYNFSGHDGSNGEVARTGLDARYEITPQLSAVATLNPDFSNIESDVLNLDFSYSTRLERERRPFFLEGGDFLRAGGGGSGGGDFGPRIFASQRIPRVDAGLKFYGKTHATGSIGLLGVLSGRRNDLIFRYRETLSANDSVTANLVRLSEPGIENTVYQLSGSHRRGDASASWVYARSLDHEGNGERWTGTLGYFGTQGGLSVWHSRTSAIFLARNGFVPFTDIVETGSSLFQRRQWRTGPLRELRLSLSIFEADHTNGHYFQRNASAGIDLRTANDIGLGFDYSQGGYEQYRDHVSGVSLFYPASDFLHSVGLSYSFGNLQGAKYRRISPFVSYRFGERLTLRISHDSRRHIESREQDIATMSYDIDRATSVTGRLIRRNSGTNWFLSLRRSGFRGLEYYVILGDPNADRFRDRLVVKMVTPFP